LCFDPFPFPDCGEHERAAIAALAEELDGLRKERLRLNPDLTLTMLYNVLAKLHAAEMKLHAAEMKLHAAEILTDAERDAHDRGLVAVIRRLHDDLDRAVFAAYGWPADISDDDLLARLVALNRERAEEEFRGKIRWLRPEFQAGIAAAPAQREMEVAPAAAAARRAWPRALPDQFKAVRDALAADPAPAAAEAVAARFLRARRGRVAAVLATLVSLGQAREAAPGRYTV
jgi:hypothetical protein